VPYSSRRFRVIDSSDDLVDMLPGIVWGDTDRKRSHRRVSSHGHDHAQEDIEANGGINSCDGSEGDYGYYVRTPSSGEVITSPRASQTPPSSKSTCSRLRPERPDMKLGYGEEIPFNTGASVSKPRSTVNSASSRSPDPRMLSFDEIDNAEGWQTMDENAGAGYMLRSKLQQHDSTESSRAKEGLHSVTSNTVDNHNLNCPRYESLKEVVRNITHSGYHRNPVAAASNSSVHRPPVLVLDTGLTNQSAVSSFLKQGTAEGHLSSYGDYLLSERIKLMNTSQKCYDSNGERRKLRHQRLKRAVAGQSLQARSSDYELLGCSR
jgi:hypothetical protein